MTDLKLYQIPKSVLMKEPKPTIEIDFLEELEEQGFAKGFLETPQTLSVIGRVAGLCAEKLGHAYKTNYGVLSIFDNEEMTAYEKLVENFRMTLSDDEGAPPQGKAKKDKKKKKKKK